MTPNTKNSNKYMYYRAFAYREVDIFYSDFITILHKISARKV